MVQRLGRVIGQAVSSSHQLEVVEWSPDVVLVGGMHRVPTLENLGPLRAPEVCTGGSERSSATSDAREPSSKRTGDRARDVVDATFNPALWKAPLDCPKVDAHRCGRGARTQAENGGQGVLGQTLDAPPILERPTEGPDAGGEQASSSVAPSTTCSEDYETHGIQYLSSSQPNSKGVNWAADDDDQLWVAESLLETWPAYLVPLPPRVLRLAVLLVVVVLGEGVLLVSPGLYDGGQRSVRILRSQERGRLIIMRRTPRPLVSDRREDRQRLLASADFGRDRAPAEPLSVKRWQAVLPDRLRLFFRRCESSIRNRVNSGAVMAIGGNDTYGARGKR